MLITSELRMRCAWDVKKWKWMNIDRVETEVGLLRNYFLSFFNNINIVQ